MIFFFLRNSSFCLRWKELWQLLDCGSYMMRSPKVDFCLVSLYFEDLVGESDGQTYNNITAHTYTHSMESLGWVCGVQRRFCGDDTWMSFRGWRGVDQVRMGKGIMGRENSISRGRETGKSMLHVGKQEFRHKVGNCGGRGWREWVRADVMHMVIWTLSFRQRFSEEFYVGEWCYQKNYNLIYWWKGIQNIQWRWGQEWIDGFKTLNGQYAKSWGSTSHKWKSEVHSNPQVFILWLFLNWKKKHKRQEVVCWGWDEEEEMSLSWACWVEFQVHWKVKAKVF